jgi:hypothetical protein
VILFRLGLLIAVIVLIAGSIHAAQTQGLGDGLAQIWNQRWGAATLIDLYVGLGIAALWMWQIEGRRWSLGLWYVALLGLGNMGFASYMLVRALRTSSVRACLIERY